ncbi:hypothetical protein V8C35DRAFT_60916 [Trichoderma chlorosporum]
MSAALRHVAIAVLSILIWIGSETLLATVVSSLSPLTNRRLAISKGLALAPAQGGIQGGKWASGVFVEGKLQDGGNWIRGLATAWLRILLSEPLRATGELCLG